MRFSQNFSNLTLKLILFGCFPYECKSKLNGDIKRDKISIQYLIGINRINCEIQNNLLKESRVCKDEIQRKILNFICIGISTQRKGDAT